MSRSPAGPLTDIRVLDVSTLFAGPLAATFLGDFGADVIKVEHPTKPDAARGHGPAREGVNLWWKTLGRNKRAVTLNLGTDQGAELLLRLVAEADVLIENFRPGTLERWNLAPERLHEVNPRLVIARVTAFGQFGPYAARPGFGSLAEAMSGFAALTGESDGPPTLPPFGLADGIAALATSYAVMVGLHNASRSGEGQVVDMAIIEPILMLLGGQITAYDQLGHIQPRVGNRSVNNAPRNVYRTGDGEWVAVSTSSQSIAERVLHLVGRSDLTEQSWFGSGHTRAQHADELDDAVASWIGQRPTAVVLAEFERAHAAVAPVYDVQGVMTDPQYAALGTVQRVEDDQLGEIKMQNVLFRMSGTPGSIRWPGRSHGQDTDAVLKEIGVTAEQLAALRERGVV
ncbi:crotonobetainyl-CoA:carnitine CoA-transferase CaiB-like acyl-CoA transferase [Arthrobacter pigmenti]|uniref:Crotonobetainyl-CoA:carnitine CoA-transferase CaiB-like acyl-CoA transferase n=1 Tax=Arthrobacter pigmenti TaxID=271432 RepID=A0A846RRB1_9MICC|nr:CoA transferase [Arthrobacter pigmenti]NJC22697.1 crotonobetainyl-CoA:carnitine CoA-transferase CaiB-like acyl-CoA transferase [Arthrobacter pigmenti]